MPDLIAVAGATGNLGRRIVKALRERGADVRALVRPGTPKEKLEPVEKLGATVLPTDFADANQVVRGLSGVACVVSALQGQRDVIVDAQSALLDGAVAAGVTRFIPSDYSIDFTRMEGANRNLDLRLEFDRRLDATKIRATSVFNGGFTDLLPSGMFLLDLKEHRVAYWGGAEQPMQFTTMDDTAAFTAAAALDKEAPRFLHVAGDIVSPLELAAIAKEVFGEPYTAVSLGTVEALKEEIQRLRAAAPTPDPHPFPRWLQLQYSLALANGLAVMEPLDNSRYPDVRITRIKEFLSAARAQRR